MATQFRVNDAVSLYAAFRVRATGTLTDPTTVSLKLRTPSGVATTYTYAGTTVTKDSTGRFSKQVTVDEAGVWAFQWAGTGTVAKVEEGTFEVLPSDYGL